MKIHSITITDGEGKQIANINVKKKQTTTQALKAWRKSMKQTMLDLQDKLKR